MKTKRIIVFALFSFLLFVTFYYVRMYATYAQVCMTTTDVANDQRCLFIYNNKVYEKGTRAQPHQGNQCGTDVTAIIPSFHYMSVAQYLDPNYVGNICAAVSPSPTFTPAPTMTQTPGCATKSQGDANCNGKPDLVDYEIWRREYIGDRTNSCSLQNLTTAACQDDADHDGNIMDADFNGDGKVSLADYQIWRSFYLRGVSQPTATVNPQQGTMYVASLDSQQSGTGSSATGTGSVLVAPDGKSATVTLTSTLDSSGNITAEHIHGPGALAGQYDLQLFPLHPGTQTIDLSTLAPIQINDLVAGRWYFNIHTFAFQGGEIRGTIHK